MQDFLPVVSSVLGVFLVMGTGAVCRRRGWLTRHADQSLARLCTSVLLPAYLASRILDGPPLGSLETIAIPAAFGFAMTAAGFLIGRGFAAALGPAVGLDTLSKQRAFALSVGIANYGYIPLPLAEEFYRSAVVDLILHNVGVELAMWSVGIAVITGSAAGGWRRAILSPPFVSVIASITLVQTSLDSYLPDPMLTAITQLGDCAIPLGLVLGGALIIDFVAESRSVGSLGVAAAAIGIRQIVMPLLMLSITGLLVASSGRGIQLRQVMMLEAAMPSAIFPIVLVRLYDQDTQTALKVVLATSLAAIVLIPVWLAIGGWWLGV
jgi:predicted permease